MGIKDNTKRLFSETLQDMMRTTDVDKIRVKDLCARCGADRQTFYYHFHDKYELIAWIFAQDYEDALSASPGEYPEEHAADTLRRMYSKRAFYRKAFRDRSQNAISRYLYDYFVKLGQDAVISRFGKEGLDRFSDYAIKAHAFACIGHTVQWLNGTSDYSPEEFAHFQYLMMPEVLREAYGIEI